jgi:hypothetical protein
VQLNHIDPDGAGGADIQLVIETWLKQQARFRLPGDRETVIYPLTFKHQMAVPSGLHSDVAAGSVHSDPQQPEAHANRWVQGLMTFEAEDVCCSSVQSPLWNLALTAVLLHRDGTLLGLLVAEAPDMQLSPPIQDSPPAFDPSTVDYRFVQLSGLSAFVGNTADIRPCLRCVRANPSKPCSLSYRPMRFCTPLLQLCCWSRHARC